MRWSPRCDTVELRHDHSIDCLKRHTSNLSPKTPNKKHRRISPHVFRHSTAEGLLEQGVDINVIRARLGHVSLETTNRYVEITLRTKQTAVAACLPPT